MEFEIITANNADELKVKIDQFKTKQHHVNSYYRYHEPMIISISITTNGNDYIAAIEYCLKGVQ